MSIINSQPLILANWKMNLSVGDSISLAKRLATAYAKRKLAGRIQLVVVPSFPALVGVAEALKRRHILLGAQDVFWKSAGPFTGEVSASVLKEVGVSFVVVGHSERRQYLKETNEMVRQKLLATLAQGLTPVLCVGEALAQRQAGRRDQVITEQVTEALRGVELKSGQELVVAYEPVWVIGSGKAVDPADAQATARIIASALLKHLPASVVDRQVRVIYGGSVDPSNITSFLSHAPISGVLVGGASLDPKRFIELLTKIL